MEKLGKLFLLPKSCVSFEQVALLSDCFGKTEMPQLLTLYKALFE